jgi:hypothetical protein
MTVPFYEMWEPTGGWLTVEYDDRGPARITDSVRATRWERWDEPWPQLLDRGASAVHDGAVRVTEAYCRAHAVRPTTEVFALMLTYVAQGSLHVSLSFGLETDRQRWLDDPVDPGELATNLWYLSGNGEGPIFIDEDVIDGTLESLLLREAALKQPGDPYRVVLNAAAAWLARHDWSSTLTTTDDFIVYIAEHDEGYAPKHDSLRAANPAERLALGTPTGPPACRAARVNCSTRRPRPRLLPDGRVPV